MSFKLREIFFFLGILWATTLPPGNAEKHLTSADTAVPDVVLRYEMDKFPSVTVFCPANSSKKDWVLGGIIMGVECDPGTEFDYKIRVPILTDSSLFWPKRLSITVSKDEDAIVVFQKAAKRQLLWNKEGNKWPKIPLLKGKNVMLPHDSLKGSGFVYFGPVKKSDSKNYSLYSAVSIIIRECPRDRYGENCTGWCKDCMYGGICHGRSGECVCPPGRKGNQCQEGCENSGFYGRNCDKQEVTYKYIQFCLPAPYGCSCGPGYKGFQCQKACDKGRWGVDCSQSCGHCESNECNRENGKCEGGDDDVRPCAGDLLGLPRLRKGPRVTTSSGVAEVSFEGEESDGALPHGAKIMGYQAVVWKTDQEMKEGQAYNVSESERSAKLTSLELGTDYQVAVLVMVQLNGSKECIVNGALRGERIHNTSFIMCPEEPPVPSNITVRDKTQSGFTVSWKESDFPRCKIGYEWQVKDEGTGEDKPCKELNETSFSVTDLKSYTNYSVVIESVIRNTDPERKSRPVKVTVKTLPKAPQKVTNVTVLRSNDSLNVTWGPPIEWPPTGDLENYKIIWFQKEKNGAKHENLTNETWFNIKGPEANQTYNIEIYAKNKDVDAYGQPEELIAATAQTYTNNTYVSEYRESAATSTTDLKSKQEMTSTIQTNDCPQTSDESNRVTHKITSTTIVVYFVDSEIDGDSEGVSYNLTLDNKTRSLVNGTFMSTFSNLEPAHTYDLTIKKCWGGNCCVIKSEKLTTEFEVEKTVGLIEVPEGELPKILLPKVASLPASQYIVVMEKKDNITEDARKDRSVEIVKEYIDSNNTKNNRSIDTSKEKIEGWVAGMVNVSDNSTKEFEIGNGTDDNKSLGDKEYSVVVVTEKKSGNESIFVASDPVNVHGKAVASGLSGIMFGALIFLVLIVLFAWTYKKNQNKIIVRVSEEDPESFLPVQFVPGRDDNDSSPEEEQVISRPKTEEVVILHQVPKENVKDTEQHDSNTKRIPFVGIGTYLSKVIDSSEIDAEFNSVPKTLEKSCSHSEHPENRPKNRHEDILPYNDTRVKLPRLALKSFSDYINANFVQGHLLPKCYIAAQGPMNVNEDTTNDFWRMIWHTKSQLLVMAADKEMDTETVAQYWPPEETVMAGGCEITLKSTEDQMDYIIRTLTVRNDEEVRQIKQYHYNAWPDHGVPQHMLGLTQMLNSIRSEPRNGPIVVHCSDGTGRTGTILLVMSVLDQINQSGYMDAHETLTTLRNGRAGLVENTMQYNFAHKLLQDILTGQQTSSS